MLTIPSPQLCVSLASGGDPTYAFNVKLAGEEVHGTSELSETYTPPPLPPPPLPPLSSPSPLIPLPLPLSSPSLIPLIPPPLPFSLSVSILSIIIFRWVI